MDDLKAGALIRTVRVRRGWRQQDVSEKAGVSRSQVAVAEAGRLEALSIRRLRAICAALEI